MGGKVCSETGFGNPKKTPQCSIRARNSTSLGNPNAKLNGTQV